MKRRYALLIAIAGVFAAWSLPSLAQGNARAYTEAPVLQLSYIRTEPGKFDEYLQYLGTTYKAIMEEQKKAGIILDYAVYSNQPLTPTDPEPHSDGDVGKYGRPRQSRCAHRPDHQQGLGFPAGFEPGVRGPRPVVYRARRAIASAADAQVMRPGDRSASSRPNG